VGHQAERSARAQAAEAEEYPRWAALLRARFSLLLYGLGSKAALLNHFAATCCTDGGCVLANGFFPDLRPRTLLAAAAAALSPSASPGEFRARPPAELLAHIAAAAATPGRRLYVVVHNIDGPALRGAEAQALLAALAATPGVHLLASADHCHFPLLWPAAQAAAFNWAWLHTPTYAPYVEETAATPQLLAQRGEARAVRGAVNVLRVLTPNARAIFRVLAEAALGGQPGGLTRAELYTRCREGMLVGSDSILSTHLQEFGDHGLVRRVARKQGGGEALVLTLPREELELLLREIEALG